MGESIRSQSPRHLLNYNEILESSLESREPMIHLKVCPRIRFLYLEQYLNVYRILYLIVDTQFLLINVYSNIQRHGGFLEVAMSFQVGNHRSHPMGGNMTCIIASA